MDLRHLQWPFLADLHATLGARAETWAAAQRRGEETTQVDATCREWVRALGSEGFLRYCVPAAHGGALDDLDSRALCVLREVLAYHDALADFSFAMQGLGSAPVSLTSEHGP